MNPSAQSSTSAIPSVDDIDAAWLSEVLGVEVAKVRQSKIIHGTTTKAFLDLDYADSTTLPAKMLLKGGYEAHSAMLAFYYRHEARVYAEVLPHVGGVHPRCFFADAGADATGTILLEDLAAAGATFGSPLQTMKIEQAERVLHSFASLHASSWSAPILDANPWLGVHNSANVSEFLFSKENWDTCAPTARFDYLTGDLIERVKARDAFDRLVELDLESPRCLLHGDSHVANLYFLADGTSGFLDWQGAMAGRWSHDVAYFLSTALAIEDRRNHERALLARYLQYLAAAGGPVIDFDDAWLEYRRAAYFGLLWCLTTPMFQPEEVCVAAGQRCGAAVADHRSLDLLTN
ncbi:phosphotransferase [Mycolicibacterium porcinum]|uniref:Phosphotransferase n=1 Tax=Mycolicibacterium porcinum TaxID=39693 RepID=A0AAW5SVS7_9MYCO|nr:phosphotransferase [Mycolicibacterium porcinum]MCV7386487.1 phosphotransferase [Mycolicibacterium porcinum]CDO30843.1 phosphotransferase enzyme family protein [Mycolicibacterium vulneris]